jgi:hypothetical protein
MSDNNNNSKLNGSGKTTSNSKGKGPYTKKGNGKGNTNHRRNIKIKDTTATTVPDVISNSDTDPTTFVNVSTSPLQEQFNKTAYRHYHEYLFSPATGNLFASSMVDDYEPFGHYANNLQIDIETMFFSRLLALGEKSVRQLTPPTFEELRNYFQATFGAMRYIYLYDAFRAMVYTDRFKDYEGNVIIPQEFTWYIEDMSLDRYAAQELIDRYKQRLRATHALPPMWQSVAAYMSSPFTMGHNHRFTWWHRPLGLSIDSFELYTGAVDAQMAIADGLQAAGTFIRQLLDWAIEFEDVSLLYDDSNKGFLVENYPIRDDQLRSADYLTPSFVQTYGGEISDFQLAFLPLHNNAAGYEGFAGQITDAVNRVTKSAPGQNYIYGANEMASKVVNPAIGTSQIVFKDRIPLQVTPEQVSYAARKLSRTMLQYNTLNQLLTVVDGNLVRERRYKTARDGSITDVGTLSVTT